MNTPICTLRSVLVSCAMGAMLCGPALKASPGPASEAQASPARIVDSIDESHLVTLRGNVHPLARAVYDAGRVSPEMPMGDLVLVLRRSPEMQAAFDRFVAGLYDQKSQNYHQWLSPEAVGDEFGPAQSDVDAIANWLTGHGFTIDEVTKDRLSIRFSGTAALVESAFHTEIHHLNVKGAQHVANMSEPQIPAALAPVVVGIKALHNFFPHPLHRLGSQVALNRETGKWERTGAPSSVPTKRPGVAAPSGVRPEFGTLNGYGNVIEDVAPYDFATIYNVLPLWKASTAIDGTGQTIAIAGTSNINLADVASFRSAFGLPAKAPTVLITNNDPGACPGFESSCSGGLVENTLDVEWSGAVAKGASIVLVTSSAPTPTSDPLYLSESYIVQNKTAPIMNVSYGACELVLGAAGNVEYNNLWETAASEGIAVFVASGDAGSPACDQDFDQYDGVPYAAQFGVAVSGIASTTYDTAVGGTDFNWGSTAAPYWSSSNNTSGTVASALGYVPEVVWNDTCTNPLVLPGLEADAAYLGVTGVNDAESACNFVLADWQTINTDFGVNIAGLDDTIGGGGGASQCTQSNAGDPLTCSGGYPKPSWQAGVQGIPSDGLRDIPDVSFFASNGFLGSAYLICVSGDGSACTYSATAEPTAQEVGGTSVASPAMAGVMALINQKSGASQGNPNSVLYALAAKQSYANCSAEKATTTSSCVFNDVDSGTNNMPCITGSPYCTTLYSSDEIGTLYGYNAGVGYDDASGLGSLNVANVVNNWPAVAPFVTLSTTSLTFASTVEGYAAATQAVTLKNTGKLALSLSGTGMGISITGANATSFSQTNNCGTSVAAGASCAITVTFKPTAIGTLTAAVSIADNAYGSPQPVALKGTAVAPSPTATLSASSLAINSQPVGTTSAAADITLKNTGTAALTISGVTITGSNASLFSQSNNCGTSVAIGASCAIAITFKPTAAGTFTATLNVADNAAGTPQTVALSGTGVAGASTLTSPAQGATLAGPSVAFAWTAISGATGYYLQIGTKGTGSYNLYNSGLTTATSYTFASMPTNGGTINVRLITKLSSGEGYVDYTFTAATSAVLSTPTPGTTFKTPGVTFKWTAGVGVTGYYFQIGTKGVGSYDLYNSGLVTTTSYALSTMPTTGETIYARLISSFHGAETYADYTYTAATHSVLTTPAPGSTLTGASVMFDWTAGVGATGYYLQIGTKGAGSYNLYNSGLTTATTYTFTAMPTNGETINVRLMTSFGGTLVYVDYTYTAATAAAVLSPAPSSTGQRGNTAPNGIGEQRPIATMELPVRLPASDPAGRRNICS